MKFFTYKKEYEKHLHIARDWGILVTIFFLLVAVSIGSNLWFFRQVSEGNVLGSAEVKTTPVFNEKVLADIETIFKTRDSEQQKFLFGTYHFVDPSK